MGHGRFLTRALTHSIAIWLTGSVLTLTACTHRAADPVGYAPERFEFRIDPWVSLHHFAYHLARAEARELRLRGRVSIRGDDRQKMGAVFWQAFALVNAAYQPYLDKDLLFDPALRAIGAGLSTRGPEGIPDRTLADALALIMPIYRRDLWPDHKALSDEFLARLNPLLAQHGQAIALQLADELESDWPNAPIIVEISAYSNWAGAFSHDAPNRISMSSGNADIGRHALEMLFHEALHTQPIGANLKPTIDAALRRGGVDEPGLWHDALFYAAGNATRDALGQPDHVTFAEDVGIATRKREIFDAIEAAWTRGSDLEEKANILIELLSAKKAPGR